MRLPTVCRQPLTAAPGVPSPRQRRDDALLTDAVSGSLVLVRAQEADVASARVAWEPRLSRAPFPRLPCDPVCPNRRWV